jgi:hypothetical protein
VICPACQRDNQPKRRYCGACGCNFDPACRACGFANERKDRFCGGCGLALATAASAVAASAATAASAVASAPPPPATTARAAAATSSWAAGELAGLFNKPAVIEEATDLPEQGVDQADLDRLFGGGP